MRGKTNEEGNVNAGVVNAGPRGEGSYSGASPAFALPRLGVEQYRFLWHRRVNRCDVAEALLGVSRCGWRGSAISVAIQSLSMTCCARGV